MSRVGAALVAALAAPLLWSGGAPTDRCAALAELSTPQLEVTTATDGAFCRVTAVARPRPAARIAIELWLPPADRWSGRYYQMGNGGFAGHIDSATLAAAARRGDAAAATDTGHVGDGFDARWARGRPDLIEDYASRSIKVTADTTRRLINAFYGREPRRRYFMGCSFGGRQALVAAAKWPADWDGVIAGAAALAWPDRLLGFARIQRAVQAPGAAVPLDRLPPLIAAARARCRPADASACGVATATRACHHGHRALCLSPRQATALATIERAGYPLATADAEGWRQWMLQPDADHGSQLALATQAFRHVFPQGEDWTARDPRPPAIPADTRRAFDIGSIAGFVRRGGRIISYFGQADPVLPPAFAVSDARAIGATPTGYRLYVVPGMGHCQGGRLAPRFGQSLPAPSRYDDPRHDLRRALENWVERDRSPGSLIATVADSGQTLVVKPAILAMNP